MYSWKRFIWLIAAGVLFSFQLSSTTFAELSDGLAVYLDFDELDGDTFADISGNGNDGVLVGNLGHVDGKLGMAIQNDGAANFVRIAHDPSFDPVDGKITVMVWIYPSDEVNHAGLGYEQAILHWNDAPNEYTYHFGLHNGKADLIMVESNGTWRQATGATLVSPGEWHHIAGVADGSNVIAYLDGKQDAIIAYDGPPTWWQQILVSPARCAVSWLEFTEWLMKRRFGPDLYQRKRSTKQCRAASQPL